MLIPKRFSDPLECFLIHSLKTIDERHGTALLDKLSCVLDLLCGRMRQG
jgi:hypothetical protein